MGLDETIAVPTNQHRGDSLQPEGINGRVQVSPDDDINSKIADLPSSGGVVELSAGTWTLSSPIIDQGKSNLTILGAGWGATSIVAADGADTNVLELSQVDHLELRGIEINGNAANQSDLGDRENQCGIYLIECNDITISECYVHNTEKSCIRHDGQDANIEHFRVTDCKIGPTNGASGLRDGVSTTNNGSPNLFESVVITGNHFKNVQALSVELSAATAQATVSDNTFRGTTSNDSMSGVYSHGQHTTIGNNAFRIEPTSGSAAIRVTGTHSIEGNVIREFAGGDGILVEGTASGVNNISGNVIKAVAGHGITNARPDTVIANNRVEDAGNDGINNSGNDCVIDGNRVKGSTNQNIDDTGTGTVGTNLTGDPN